MKVTKQSRREAKQLFQGCLVSGVLDEGRVRQTVQMVTTKKPRGYVAILSTFQRLVKLEIQRRTARIESATTLSPAMQSSVRENLTRVYGQGLTFNFAENPSLIGGVRIKVGSDVFDGSVHARLANLQDSFSM